MAYKEASVTRRDDCVRKATRFGLAIGATLFMQCSEPDGEDPADVLESTSAVLVGSDTCRIATFDGHTYWFCDTLRTFASAQTQCGLVSAQPVRLESPSEESFVRQNLVTDSWLGAQDTVEGNWKWITGGHQFFTGASNGTTVAGFYSHWTAGEPNNSFNEDCAVLARQTGTWNDVPCGLPKSYVCETPADLCATSNAKTQPAVCGCGTADVDTDSDGVANCLDECPLDVTTDRQGTCGCPSDPEPANTPCFDGPCGGSKVCNALGSCGNALQCSPATTCDYQRRGESEYYFCHDAVTQAQARQFCRNTGMDLAEVESIEENTFLHQHGHLLGIHWLGGEQTSQGQWSWPLTGQQFWSNGIVNGRFTTWQSTQPAWALGNCTLQDSPTGQWTAADCSFPAGFICERSDHCPGDPQKTRPGVCGCGRPDRDWSGDGQVDCSWLGGFDNDPALTPSTIAVGSRPQMDMTVSAITFMEGGIEVEDYIAICDDRTEKRDAIFADPDLADAIAAGDSDGDLVPDSIDQCPHTPALTPTDDVGCTDSTRMDDPPDGDAVRAIVNGAQVFRAHPSTNCDSTEAQMPELIAGYINNSQIASAMFAAFFTFEKPACPVRLRLEAITEDPAGWPYGAGGQVLYFETGSADFSNVYSNGQVVQGAQAVIMTNAEFGSSYQNLWNKVIDSFGEDSSGPVANPYRMRMRAMAVYGGGLQSNWSNWVDLRVYGSRSP